VYNCADRLASGLPALISFLKEYGHLYEIIIVDDGSTDCLAVCKIAQQYDCLYLKHDINLGKGAAIKKAIFAFSGDVVIFMDGDFPFRLTVINDMILKLEEPGIGVVIGDRTHHLSSYPKNIKLYRKLGSRLLSFIISNFYIYGFKDTQCGIKGFTAPAAKKIFEKVTINGFAFDLELLFIAKTNGLRIDKVPVQVRNQEESSVKVVKDGLLMLYHLLRLTFNKLTGKYRINE
jgi:dolichyl-phosphate beta-glucosyltransferase